MEGRREGRGGGKGKKGHHPGMFGVVCKWSWEKCTWLVLWAGNPVQTKDVSISSGDIVSLSSVAGGCDQLDLGRERGKEGRGEHMNKHQNS